MKTRHYILLIPLLVLMTMLTVACSSDTVTDEEQPLPEGMGRIRITICTPENNSELTRAVNTGTTWLDPDHDWEKLHSFRILIFDKTTGELVDIIERTSPAMYTSSPDPSYQQSFTVTSDAIPEGAYYIYATANCHSSVNTTTEAYDDGFVKGNTYSIATIDAMTLKLSNGYSEKNIPMSGKLTTTAGGSTLKEVSVTGGTVTDVSDTPLTVWRMLGKMDFKFINETSGKIQIKGIDVEPINLGSSSTDGAGIYLFSKDDLTSEDNLAAGTGIHLPTIKTGPFTYTPASAHALTLEAKNSSNTDEGNLFFYVNETDATYTVVQNQFSVRFKIARQKGSGWYDDEIRYGLTTHYGDGSTGQNGFNVIRRNDWIHIPVYLRDWTFRMEYVPLVPIAGYPAVLYGSDALSATFSTGGYIFLKPYAQKNNDGIWRDFYDSEVTFDTANGVHWTNANGTDVSGSDQIVTTGFVYDDYKKTITGELNNTLSPGTYTTTLTVNVKLGPSGSEQEYSFTCNIILKVPTP